MSSPSRRPGPSRRLSGGGYGQAQLTHALGLALWLTGLRGEEVFALMSAPLYAPVELHDAFSMRYEGGAIGTMSGGSCHLGAGGNKDQLEVRAIGSDGQLHVDLERELVWLYRGRRTRCAVPVDPDAGRLRLRRAAARRSSTSPSAATSTTARRGSSAPARSRSSTPATGAQRAGDRSASGPDRFGPAGGSGSRNRAKPAGLIRASSSCTVAPRKRIR